MKFTFYLNLLSYKLFLGFYYPKSTVALKLLVFGLPSVV